MTRFSIVLIAAIALASAGCGSYHTARGRADARKDIGDGTLAIEMTGLRYPWDTTYKRLLRERYDIELRSVAGCIVSPEIAAHSGSYNEVMRAEIARRFGRDTLNRTAEDARKLGPGSPRQ